MDIKIEHEIFALEPGEAVKASEHLRANKSLKLVQESIYMPEEIDKITKEWLHFESKIENLFSHRAGFNKSEVITTNRYLKMFHKFRLNSYLDSQITRDFMANLERSYFEDFITHWRKWQSVLINSVLEFGEMYRPGKKDNSKRMNEIYTDIVNQTFKMFYDYCPDNYKKNEVELVQIRFTLLNEGSKYE